MSRQTKLWKDKRFVEDAWRHARAMTAKAMSSCRWRPGLASAHDQRKAGSNRLGVLLAPGDKLDAIVADLDQLPLVALSFPAYNDGRSHSKAALLKSRHGFKGEVRAVGDVLVDQIPLLLRNGFDTLEVTNAVAQQRLADGKIDCASTFTTSQQQRRQTSVPAIRGGACRAA